MSRKITENMETVFNFIREYLSEYGYPPAHRDIARGLSKDIKNVHGWLEALERVKWIKIDRGRSRSITILKTDLHGREFAVPRIQTLKDIKKDANRQNYFLPDKNARRIEVASLTCLLEYFENTELREFEQIIPVPVTDIARWLDYEVEEAPLEPGLSGLQLIDQNKILLNIKDLSERQRFTLAHEIGHIKLHLKILVKSGKKELSALICQSDDLRKMEVEANHFAVNLLMPPTLFSKIVNETCSQIEFTRNNKEKENLLIEKVSHRFQTSRDATKYRLRDFGFIE